jgi:hypothetical protein
MFRDHAHVHGVKVCVMRVILPMKNGPWWRQFPPARSGGRPRDVNMREVINGLLYLQWTGCQWQALPKDLPPKSTVHHYFKMWDWDGPSCALRGGTRAGRPLARCCCPEASPARASIQISAASCVDAVYIASEFLSWPIQAIFGLN